jgi:hypothetical protein
MKCCVILIGFPGWLEAIRGSMAEQRVAGTPMMKVTPVLDSGLLVRMVLRWSVIGVFETGSPSLQIWLMRLACPYSMTSKMQARTSSDISTPLSVMRTLMDCGERPEVGR